MTSSDNLEDPGVMEITGKILIATIIALFVVLVLVFLFHIYARWLWLRRQQLIDNNHHHRHQQQHHSGVTVLRRGLDVSFLKTLPVLQFHSNDFKDGLECSVCLSELQEGETARILPKCNHAFHADCIDMWFHSHSTCPICRNPVSEQIQEISVESLLENHHQEQQQQQLANSVSVPTNVLFWGDETEVSTLTSQLEELEANHQPPTEPTSTSTSSSSSQTNNDRQKPDLVIDIPSARQLVGDDQSTPLMTSLRRILSSGRRFYSFSPASYNSNQQGTTPQI